MSLFLSAFVAALSRQVQKTTHNALKRFVNILWNCLSEQRPLEFCAVRQSDREWKSEEEKGWTRFSMSILCTKLDASMKWYTHKWHFHLLCYTIWILDIFSISTGTLAIFGAHNFGFTIPCFRCVMCPIWYECHFDAAQQAAMIKKETKILSTEKKDPFDGCHFVVESIQIGLNGRRKSHVSVFALPTHKNYLSILSSKKERDICIIFGMDWSDRFSVINHNYKLIIWQHPHFFFKGTY